MSGLNSDTFNFGKWRGYLWPVHHYELKKLVPMLFVFFLISFDYNILRTLKDTVVITAKSSGAEAIPFIKVWAMFPGAILMTLLFTKLSNRYSRETVFYLMISTFLLYFFLFIFVLYPAKNFLQPTSSADALEKILPQGFKGFVMMYRHWILTVFYVMCELWSSIVLTVLFWGFANHITPLQEAKRFYGLFGIGANLSGVVAGQTCVYLNERLFHVFNPNFPFGQNKWEQSMIMQVSFVIVAGLLALLIFRWINLNVLSDSRFYNHSIEENKGEQKKMSMRESISYILNSKYLMTIAIIVVSYNLVINLTEVIWKQQLHELYPNSEEYNTYSNQVLTMIGVVSTFSALFISGNSVRIFGWTFTALLTPAILLITSVGFFTFFFLKDLATEMVLGLLGASPLAIVVFFGSTQNILCRGAKYSVFDATKEMAFVPLHPECKLKGKAVIDGVVSRLGKTGGSVVYQGLFLFFSSMSKSAPCIALVLLIVICIWMGAVRLLGKRFVELTTTSASGEEFKEIVQSQESVPMTLSIQQGSLKEQVI